MNSRKKINETILKESKVIEDVLNNNLLLTFGRMHNIKDDFNLFDIKQEVVASKGYFLDVKKKYCLHITNSEGEEVDELFIRGLITQRSDYPSLTKERLMTIIHMLVEEETPSFVKIKEFIDKTRLEITKLVKEGNITISRPVSYKKNLKDYSAKSLPFQIKAMELWNKAEYQHFMKGTRGYCFSILGIDREKAPQKVKDVFENQSFDRIAIPQVNGAKLPSYYITDAKSQVEFSWDNRINEFIRPIVKNLYDISTESDLITF